MIFIGSPSHHFRIAYRKGDNANVSLILISLAIGGQRLEIRSNNCRDCSSLRLLDHFTELSCVDEAPPEGPQSPPKDRSYCDTEQSATVLALKTFTGTPRWCGIDGCKRRSVKRTSRTGAMPFGPILTDGDPHLSWELIGKLMEREGRDEADHTLGHPLCCLGETVMSVEGRIRKLVKPPRKSEHLAIPLHAAHGCRRYARGTQFGETRDTARFQHGLSNMALRRGFVHDTFARIAVSIIRGFVSSCLLWGKRKP